METTKTTEHDPEITNLVWRKRKSGGYGAHFRKRIDGRDVWAALDVVAFTEADRKKVRAMVQKKIVDDGLAGLRDSLGMGAKPAPKLSLLTEIMAAYEEFYPGADLTAATARQNLRGFRYVIAKTQARALEELRADVLTPALPADLAAAMLRERREAIARAKLSREEAEREEGRVQVSIGGQWRFFKSLFSREALASAPYRRLVLPDLAPMMAVRIGATSKKDYEPWAPEVVARVKAGVAGLQAEDPALWLVAMLEMNADLRKSSAAHARWDWFGREGVDDVGRPCVWFSTKVAKGGKSTFPFDLGLYREMRALGMDRQYILPGEALEDREALIARLVGKLREWGLNRPADLAGVQRDKPNHELRKICTHETAAALGDDEAMARGGWSDSGMLDTYRQRGGKRVHRVV